MFLRVDAHMCKRENPRESRFSSSSRDMAVYYLYQDKTDKKTEAKESEQKTTQDAEEEEEEKGAATRATTRSASRLVAER